MNIIVCVKQVPDPETPPASFKIDPNTNKVIPAQGVQPVIDPFAENAVEAALQLKDANPGSKVTAISMGPASARDALKQAMAMGADDSYLLTDPLFDQADSYAIALTLAEAIKKIGMPDLVLTGRESADWSAGQTGAGIAELLGLPVVSLVKKIKADGSAIRVERVVDDGYEVIEATAPAVLTISNEIGQPRYPTLKGIMAAGKKQVTNWSAADLGLSASNMGGAANHVNMVKLFVPVRDSKCDIAEGETPAEAAVALALKLRAAKVI